MAGQADIFSGLRSYQKPHLLKLLESHQRFQAALDRSDTGTGKTYVAIALFRALNIVPTVFCPLATAPSWERVAKQLNWSVEVSNYEKARGRRVDVGREDGRKLARSTYFEEELYGSGSLLRMVRVPVAAIFDEVHNCTGSKSLQSKMLISAKRAGCMIHALSATVADDPMKFKALGYALGMHKLNGRSDRGGMKNFTDWALSHGCVTDPFSGYIMFSENKERQEYAMQKINHALSYRGGRLRKSEIPGFPKTQVDVLLLENPGIKVDAMFNDLRAAYNHRGRQVHAILEEQRDLEQRREEGEVIDPEDIRPSAMELQLRIRQRLELAKIEPIVQRAKDYREQGNRIIVFLNFRESVDFCHEMLMAHGMSSGIIDGRQVGAKGAKDRQEVIDRAQRNELDAVVCNTGAGAEGINLHDPIDKVPRTVFISPPLRGDKFCQLIGRANREGGGFSDQFVVYFKDTPEEETAERLSLKVRNIAVMNDGDFNDSDFNIYAG